MKPLGKIIVITITTLITLSALSGTAYAITGNYNSDSTGYVGIIVFFADSARQQPIGYCSGVLISPTVMLTAGHATIHSMAASVSFDQSPISYSIQNGQITYTGNSPIYEGVPITYPEYVEALANHASLGNQIFSVTDLGIVLLSSPVEGQNFASLPTAGLAETLPVKTDLQVIGYGMQDQITPKNNGPANSWIGTFSRNSANVQLLSNNFQGNEKYIQCTANSAQNKGAISFGDSGGPVIYTDRNGDDFVLAVNAFVCNSNCAGVTYHTRIDTQDIIAWITNNQ